VRQPGAPSPRAWVAPRRGTDPPHEDGVEVRRLFQKRRSHAMAPCKGLLKHMCAGRTQRPVHGVQRSPRLALGAIGIDPLGWRDQHEPHRTPGKGLKPPLKGSVMYDHVSIS
jgi:hypothetical protein